MPTPEIVRIVQDGEWVTTVGSEGGGGGGGVEEITSSDMSVTITDPTGPTVDLSVSGGSQTVRFVRQEIAYTDIDVDGKAPAIPVTAGEAIIGIAWIVVEAFDDTGAVSFGGNVVNISEGSTFDFLVANMSLTDTDNANPEASSGRSQTGLSRYKQRSGVSPNIFSDPVALAASGDARFPYIGGTFVLWDDDASFNFYVPGWAHDGAAGQIRLIYYIAKTELA